MKRGIRLILLCLISLFGLFSVASCNNKTTDVPNKPVEPDIPNNPEKPGDPEQPTGYKYDGTLTVAPYKVLDANNKVVKEYSNLFQAIQYAGQNGTTKNKLSVSDGNDLKIFERKSKSQAYMFDGEYFVGLAPIAEAIKWSETKPRSYVYNGWGQNYAHLGRVMFEGSDTNQEIPFELFSGGYNYMYSKSGELKNGEWEKQGFGYFETIVRMSETSYMPSQDGEGWNAYIFVNVNAGHNCDLGVIGNLAKDGTVQWRLCRNCSHTSHGGNGFTVLNPQTVVTSMKYNEETKDYRGTDDLKFQVWASADEYHLIITNLSNNQTFEIVEKHEGANADKTQYLRFLLAASYCPVNGNPWNARSGAYLKDVIFENSLIARYTKDGKYDESMFEEFYPGADSFNYGFSQGADCASALFGQYEKDGTHDNGLSYKKGTRWINFSTFYDGSNHNQ